MFLIRALNLSNPNLILATRTWQREGMLASRILQLYISFESVAEELRYGPEPADGGSIVAPPIPAEGAVYDANYKGLYHNIN